MMDEERIRDYLLSLEPDGDPLCGVIAEDAVRRGIPIIRKETGALLKTIVTMKQPGAILEIGTAVGYSAVWMASAAPPACRITTIEKDEARIAEARENFRRAGLETRIELIGQDAEEVLPKLPGGAFDLIFLDAAKGQYGKWLPELLRLMPAGGVLIADNVLQERTILESRFAVERRGRTIHSRMREFLWEIKHSPALQSAVLPVGDGAALCVKRPEG